MPRTLDEDQYEGEPTEWPTEEELARDEEIDAAVHIALEASRAGREIPRFDDPEIQNIVNRVVGARDPNQMCCYKGATAIEHRAVSPDGRCCTDDPPSSSKP